MTWIVGFQSVSFHGHSRLLFECICRRSKYSHREGHVLSFPIVTNVPLACLRRCLSQFEAGRRHNGTARLPSRGALQEDVAFVPRILVPSESLGDQMPLACTTLPPPTPDAVSGGCFTRSTGRWRCNVAGEHRLGLLRSVLWQFLLSMGPFNNTAITHDEKTASWPFTNRNSSRFSRDATPVGGGAANLYMHARGSRKHRERWKVAISRQHGCLRG
jgi:hypothetical protein